jgi:plastocyanin
MGALSAGVFVAVLMGACVQACASFEPNVGALRSTGGEGGPGADSSPPEAGADSDLEGAVFDGNPTTFTVTVGANGQHAYSPRTLTIAVGDTVHWVWAASNHSVTSGVPGMPDGTFCSPNDTNCAGGPTSSVGATYDHTFRTAGTFSYYCLIHGVDGMTGAVTVQ